MDPAAQSPLLQRYSDAGCLVLKGTLAASPAHIVITKHAQQRMSLRDIHDSEVLDLLALPLRFHIRGKKAGRYEAAGDTGRGPLRVIYERPVPGIVLVITTYAEPG